MSDSESFAELQRDILKKYTKNRRDIDVRNGLLARSSRRNEKRKSSMSIVEGQREEWFKENKSKLLNTDIDDKNKVTINLPERMNFTTDFEATVVNLMAIRRLHRVGSVKPGELKLSRVAFDGLRSISTSAALVLTAELAKWDDASLVRLKPNIDTWDKNIYRQFVELGYFNLFKNPEKYEKETPLVGNRHLVKYIQGRFREHDKPRILQERLNAIVGNEIDEWAFLHSGLVEAIINVTHHAYPDSSNYDDIDKNWYLTGSYNTVSRQLKIVFYDQGISIPKSLPATSWGEKILQFASSKGIATGTNDANLVSAAMEMSRTRTNDEDRGKGLQDILEFVKQRQQGYLAVVSGKGFFRLDVENESEETTAKPMPEPMLGTLIVWSVILEKAENENDN